MSLANKRAAFKAALDLVSDVKGYTSRPTTPRTGDAWPILGTGERDQIGGLFAFSWSVAIYLPQDRNAADDWIDSHLDALVDAIELEDVAYVDTVSPANLGDDNSPINGLLITTRSE